MAVENFGRRQSIKMEMEMLKEERRRLYDLYFEQRKLITGRYETLQFELEQLEKEEAKTMGNPHDIVGALHAMMDMIDGLAKAVEGQGKTKSRKKAPMLQMNITSDLLAGGQLSPEMVGKMKENVLKLIPEDPKAKAEQSDKERTQAALSVTGSQNDYKAQAPAVAQILRSKGRTLSLQEIAREMEAEYKVKWDYPTYAMNAVMGYDKQIKRYSKGFYIYLKEGQMMPAKGGTEFSSELTDIRRNPNGNPIIR